MEFSKKKDGIVECIRKRTTFGEVWISVDGLLMENNMQFYAALCKRRIRASIDHGEESNTGVTDGPHGDLFLTEKGIRDQMPVLLGYTREEQLNELLSYLRTISATNELLVKLRAATKDELNYTYKALEKSGDRYLEARMWIEEELKARSFVGRIRSLCFRVLHI